MSRHTAALALLHQRPTGAVVVLRLSPAVERAHVACVLSQALVSAASQHVRAIQLAAERVRPRLFNIAPCTLDDRARQLRRAITLRDRVAEFPARDRTPGLVAVLRALLEDTPGACTDLDRAVRDAARAHGHAVTAEHEAMAAEVLS